MKLNDIERHVSLVLPKLGVNKKREICRLIFEINKRDGAAPGDILPPSDGLNFEQAKKLLLKRRYPETYGSVNSAAFYLPALEISEKEDLAEENFSPKNIFIDAGVKDTPLAHRAVKKFPQAKITVLESKRDVGAYLYSKRTETLYITEEKYDFVKPCPCTMGAAGCGYNLVNLGFGCRFECEYCFLQGYQNLNAVLLPANINDFLEKIDGANLNKGPFETVRIGSGEFTDSLVFDDITEYSKDIIKFFAARPHLSFEFKTKSVNIKNVLDSEPSENIVIGWSVNTPEIIKNIEHYTPSLDERLAAAAQVAQKGFGVAFHFDPVILHDNWRENYARVIERLAAAVPAEKVRWISAGTLRFNRELKKVIEKRFPFNTILDEEFVLGYDGKMRYSDARRREAYDFLLPLLKQAFPSAAVYLCMEQMI